MPDSYSQHGEDRLVLAFFGNQPTGFFIEAGASHPTNLSQTKLLEDHGWTGMLVEPLEKNCALLRAERPQSRVFRHALGAPEQCGPVQLQCPGEDSAMTSVAIGLEASSTSETVTLTTLNHLLEQVNPPAVDYLSLDVEGMEIDVLNGLDLERWKPRLILVEDHVKDLRLHRYLGQQGYRAIRRTGCNSWYVPRQTILPPEARVSWSERWELWRKLYLGLPFRILKGRLRPDQ